MPKETFLNLSEDKRNRFIETALEEFSQHNYDSASINVIVKKLGIARGSVYQYFEDKLDLWKYLNSHAEKVKTGYILSLDRNKYPDFWSYYKAMYIKGTEFDLEEPLCSRLLYRIGFRENSKEVLPFLDTWKERASEMFTKMVKHEKLNGSIDPYIPDDICVHFLLTMSMSVADLMQSRYKVDFEKNLREDKALFADNKQELMDAVSELIDLLEKALKP